MPLSENLKHTTKELNLLKKETYNAIVDALREKPLNNPGYSFADRQSATSHSNKPRDRFYFTAESNLPFRSIFGITEVDESAFNSPPIVNVESISELGIAFNLFTNLLPYNIIDGYGICKAIGFYDPTLLYVSDLEHFPEVGMPCGPDINSGQWGISGATFGLICISLPDESSSDSENNVWCIRTPDPVSVIGTIYTNDIPAYNPTTNTLGTGQILLQYRTPLNILENATGPDGSNLILPVYNASSSSAFAANTQVKCICVSGVGLVIIDSSSLVWGRAQNNIPHFTSGQIQVYKGAPGQESLDSTATNYTAFNHLAEIVKNEWVFLTPTGNKNIPYYAIQNEYNGNILGKATNDIKTPNDVSGNQVDVWGGNPGAETSFSSNITSRLKSIFGAITKNSWVISTFLGPDATANHGGWYISAAQRGLIYTGQINSGQANTGTKFIDVRSKIKVRLWTGTAPDLVDSGLDVDALVWFAPLLEKEWVQLEWNGEIFIITHAELDSGFEAQVLYDIAKNDLGYVFRSGPLADSDVVIDNLQVFSRLGAVTANKWVNVFRNREGFRIVSSEC